MRKQRIVYAVVLSYLLTTPSLGEPTSTSYPNHNDLSYYIARNGGKVLVRIPTDWQRRRTHIIAGMEEVMGPFPRPKTPVPLDVKTLEEHKEDGYIRRKISYHTDNPQARVNAWLLVPTDKHVAGLFEGGSKTTSPAGLTEASYRRPAILCLHQTNVRGKDSPAGLFERHNVHYAKELAQRGYVTLAPDYPSFGEAKDYDFDADEYISGSMKAIYDNVRSIDLLQSLPEVDAKSIGCIGHSLGGHNTIYTAAFEPRIKAAVTCCGFTSFHKYKGGDLTGWTSERYMPLIKSKYNLSPDRMPFDFHEVVAAIAPRAVFVVAPLHDDNFDFEGVREVLTAARPIYELLGKPENLQSVHPDTTHEFPDAERRQAYEFLDQHLKRQSKR